jgi:hypothetical protein
MPLAAISRCGLDVDQKRHPKLHASSGVEIVDGVTRP